MNLSLAPSKGRASSRTSQGRLDPCLFYLLVLLAVLGSSSSFSIFQSPNLSCFLFIPRLTLCMSQISLSLSLPPLSFSLSSLTLLPYFAHFVCVYVQGCSHAMAHLCRSGKNSLEEILLFHFYCRSTDRTPSSGMKVPLSVEFIFQVLCFFIIKTFVSNLNYSQCHPE